MADVAAFTSRCPFCSLLCPLAVERRGHELFVPGYVTDVPDVRQGVCARGHLVCDLAVHGKRLNEACVRSNGSAQTVVDPDAALDEVATRLQQFGPDDVGVVVAGENCRGIAAAQAFVQAAAPGATLAAYLPSEDEACLDGLTNCGATLASQEEVAEAEGLLVIGDPFASRPVLARAVHAAKLATDRLPMVVIDSIAGTTSKFASQAIVVPPGGEANCLAALLQSLSDGSTKSQVGQDVLSELAGDAGDAAGSAAAAAEALSRVKQLVVVVAPEFGRGGDWGMTALLAGEIARVKGGKVFAALSAANALGAYRMARNLGAARMAQLYEDLVTGGIQALLCVGVDLVTAWPRLEPTLSSRPLVVAATALPNRTSQIANITLPLALAVEEPSVAVENDGTRIEAGGGLAPPRGARSAEDLFRDLASRMGKPLSEIEVEEPLLAGPGAVRPEEIASAVAESSPVGVGQLVLVAESNALQAGDGSLSRWTRWSTLTAPAPTIRLSPQDAEALNASSGTTLSCQGISLQVEVSDRVPQGVAAVPSYFAETRKLFECQADSERGRLTIGPTGLPLTAFSA